ncbi:hypothetical protein SAMN04487949_3784 [Halogranum gelatinilyticum]|uniref:TAT (Twin-arginine translocation) pathway signal sequence n=1 Tax=Halogranum gelatinilyticum TaxID=660521 RepID=A0A1H0A0I8_9EURY|nr:hypothetical protein [Halogranum gelatinilyticum]SDN26955.1 hypothetical protein SAMN04487949_3784 [Halogranum gelatinilyticum]
MAGPHSTRRRLLATLGTAGLTGLAGCGSSSELEGEGDTIEIMPRNGTDETQQIAIRIEDSDGTTVFSHVYELEPDHLSESEGVSPDADPTRISVFVAGGPNETFRYHPDDETRRTCQRDGIDFGVTLTAEQTLAPWYTC